MPQNIRGDLLLNGLTTAEGLILPQTMGGSLYLNGLTTAEGLVLPEPLTYNIRLNGGLLITPDNIDEYRNNKSINRR